MDISIVWIAIKAFMKGQRIQQNGKMILMETKMKVEELRRSWERKNVS